MRSATLWPIMVGVLACRHAEFLKAPPGGDSADSGADNTNTYPGTGGYGATGGYGGAGGYGDADTDADADADTDASDTSDTSDGPAASTDSGGGCLGCGHASGLEGALLGFGVGAAIAARRRSR